jgi:outer membrane protein TolC
VATLQYALSVLVGEAPESRWEENVIEFPKLPALPDLGVPSELLQRRPDVRQAYRLVQAADQRLAVAIADQYPRLSISAGAEMSSVSMRDLLDDWLANLAGNAVQPLFDAGRRKAEVQRQKAVVQESVHTWSQAILQALQEVETALVQERQQTQLLENLGAQLHLARQTYERTEQSFLKGQVDYIRVLESLQSLQQLERSVVTAQRTLVARRIDLYRSIAGPCDLPAPALAQIDSLMQTTKHSEDMVQAN